MEQEEKKPEKEVLETGTYKMFSPEDGEMRIDQLELLGDNGAKRIWKLKNITPKEAVFEIIKFG
ncbi:hypothetical protein J4461_01310 [Candidatus Pacearchaeota archaeon]|nr:hypothetical protein [Candidatus Pacearchaeota archaeon]